MTLVSRGTLKLASLTTLFGFFLISGCTFNGQSNPLDARIDISRQKCEAVLTAEYEQSIGELIPPIFYGYYNCLHDHQLITPDCFEMIVSSSERSEADRLSCWVEVQALHGDVLSTDANYFVVRRFRTDVRRQLFLPF